jgi:epoxide hydrolase-like predicted phosphatase
VIEFVYFDLGNILLSFDPVLACKGLAGQMNSTPIEARKALYDSGLEEKYEHGEVTSREFAAQLRQYFGRPESEVSDSAIVESISNMFEPIESMEGVLDSVRAAGYRVGLLSNTCIGHWSWIEQQQFSVMDFSFDATILSFEVGSMKPDRRIYEVAEESANVPVETILFLDDRQMNVQAAQSYGWNAAQCLGGREAIRVLQEFRLLDITR